MNYDNLTYEEAQKNKKDRTGKTPDTAKQKRIYGYYIQKRSISQYEL